MPIFPRTQTNETTTPVISSKIATNHQFSANFSLEASSAGGKWRLLDLGSPKRKRLTPSSMTSPQPSPMTPPPLYGHSPNQGAIGEIHELSTTNHSSSGNGENHGLGVQSSGLQEADAQADTPNPFPVQREWSRRRVSELADGPNTGSQRNSRRDTQLRDGDGREHYASWQNWTS